MYDIKKEDCLPENGIYVLAYIDRDTINLDKQRTLLDVTGHSFLHIYDDCVAVNINKYIYGQDEGKELLMK